MSHLVIYMQALTDQLPCLVKREGDIFLLSIIVITFMWFLFGLAFHFLLVLMIGCVIRLWHSLGPSI